MHRRRPAWQLDKERYEELRRGLVLVMLLLLLVFEILFLAGILGLMFSDILGLGGGNNPAGGGD